MRELFETVVILSVFGLGITMLLLLLKPVALKSFPARWQYYIWLTVLLSMIIPVYKFIPQREAQRLSPVIENKNAVYETPIWTNNTVQTDSGQTHVDGAYSTDKTEHSQRLAESVINVLPYIWISGAFIYITVIAAVYAVYLFRKRRGAFIIECNPVLENTKKELGIKRKIRLKVSESAGSPMLVGIFMPVIYVPAKSISDENMRMIFLHELTHYKRRDLTVKWIALFVNAVHWFNPAAYILCANISEACELSCDMAVTRNMPVDRQKIYMQTILDLAE